jgi:large exoprotein involved in heme utilization and adhesion
VEARQNVRIESSTGEESSGNAGQITITADTLTVEDGARLWANTEGTGTGGTVRVTAQDRVRLSRQGGEVTGLFSRTQGKSPGSGAAGRVELVAPIVELTEGARIGAETLGAGAAGVIEIRAERLLTVDGSDSGISARTLPGSSGKGGVLDISAGELTVTKGGQLASGAVGGSAGDAGRMLITADTLAIAEGGRLRSVTEGSGNGSNIILRARQMTVTEMETRVEADAEETSTGNAGHILIEADTLTVATGGRIGTVTNGPGNGGNIELRVGRLLVTDGGRITAGQDALGVRHGHTPSGSGGRIQITATDLLLTQRSQIRSSTAGIGKAGEIVLEAERLMVTSGSRIDSRTSSTGQGGEIVLQARAIALRDGATIAVESTRTGRAGGIVITATDTFLSDNSTVTAAALQADGGNITLQAGSLVQLGDSRLTTTVQGGEGRGGNITIDPQFVILERSQIRADASGGPGGNVRVHAGVFLADPGSQVTASSARNVSGVIDIQAPITNLSNLVTPLPPDFAPAAALLRDPCTARLREGMVSSLVARGRASLPTTYDGILPSRLYEPQQHQTPAAGAAHTPGYMRAAAPGQRRAVPARRFQGANASALSPLRLHLLCGRP